MAAKKEGNDPIQEKLDAVIRLLQDLFILEATRGGVGQEAIRKLLGVRMARVSAIAKRME